MIVHLIIDQPNYFFFSGGKGMDLFEGGIRVPGIVRWPKKISPKTEIDIPTSLLDFRATIEDLISIKSLVSNSDRSRSHLI